MGSHNPETRKIGIQLMRKYTTEPKQGLHAYLCRGELCFPVIIVDDTDAQRVWIDATGRHHLMQRFVHHRFYDVIRARKWKGAWAGPAGGSYASDVTWDYHGIERIQQLTVQNVTKKKAMAKMIPPAAEKAWEERLGRINWIKTWGMRPMYASPRDTVAWMQIQRRNLRVAKTAKDGERKCAHQRCQDEESQQHLVATWHATT